jgi:hypothetical protein
LGNTDSGISIFRASTGTDALPVVIVACIAFVCFEGLFGRTDAALPKPSRKSRSVQKKVLIPEMRQPRKPTIKRSYKKMEGQNPRRGMGAHWQIAMTIQVAESSFLSLLLSAYPSFI